MTNSTKKAAEVEIITIPPPKFRVLALTIIGDSPYMQARFSAKAMNAMKEKMAAGSTAKKGKNREARDFEADFRGAMHVSHDGWAGIPAAAIRNACISACKVVGYHMTRAKLSVFVEADGFDRVDGSPLVKLIAPEPEKAEMGVRNATGVLDIRVRPLWRTWRAVVRVRFDEDQFAAADVTNLLSRAGMQVGIGEGRPDSKESNGMGFGLFHIENGGDQ